MQLLDPATKVGELSAQHPWFEQGDSIILRRGKLWKRQERHKFWRKIAHSLTALLRILNFIYGDNY